MKKSVLMKVMLFGLFVTAQAMALDFYVFPVREIEGFNVTNRDTATRPLVDPRAVAVFTPASQKQIISAFTENLANAYPNSIVHATQVRELIKGKYLYATDGVSCGDGFAAPVNRTYAAVVGLTRASYYEVDRGDNIEILVPITMNVQLIKPERAKIVYTISSTQYTPFVIAKKELGLKSTNDFMTKSLTTNTINQMNDLVTQVKQSFTPKDTLVKIVEKSGDLLVVDKGYEVGFKSGDELEATRLNSKDASPIIVKVLSVESSYSILKPLMGKPSKGEEYVFVFETPADDSRKPKLLPVSSDQKDQLWSPAVADLFAKDIGFQAPFQLAPVDVNFTDNMNSVQAQANCLPWDKFPSAKTVFDSRIDHPNFFLKFEMGQSPVFTNSGKGGVKTEQSFMTALTAQVVDLDGNVIFSEYGKDTYVLERVGQQGLSLVNTQEISLKNALVDLMKNFLKSVKLEPKQFKISEVKGGKFTVNGLEIPNGQNAVYEVLKPMGFKVGDKPVLMRLALDQSEGLPVSVGGATTFTYSIAPDYPDITSGDVLSLLFMPRGNTPEISACGSTFIGKDSLPANHLIPIINHVAYRSSNYIVNISDKDFYSDANRLLKNGFYKFRMPAFSPTEFCFRSGYMVKKNESTCGANGCNMKFLTALRITTQKAGVDIKDASIGEQTTVTGVVESQGDNLIGFRAMKSANDLMNELTKRFNTK